MVTDAVVHDARAALASAHHRRDEAADLAPRAPGLYAFHGDDQAWSDLALTPAFDGQPLYVGKAEQSLLGRDVGTHFATGRTGSSTVRRSLAALLADRLDLVAVPRNLARPDGRAGFALAVDGDARLSEWMERRLMLSWWVKPDVGVVLDGVETVVLRRLRPPLNVAKVGEPRARLRAARSRLTADARAWRPPAST